MFRLESSWEHKFNHNFQDTMNSLCSCSLESESTNHFFCAGKISRSFKICLMNKLIKFNSCILTLGEKSFTKLLLYGDYRYDSKTNKNIILTFINFTYSSKRSDGQLMWWTKQYICLLGLDFSVCLIISTNLIMRFRVSVKMH